MKNISLVFIIFFVSINFMYSVTSTTFSSHYDIGRELNTGQRYIDIWVQCTSTQANLFCFRPSEDGVECCFCNATWFAGCGNGQVRYEESNAEELFSYAKNKVKNGVLNGTYNSNIMISPTGKQFSRSVSWDVDTSTYIMYIDVLITEF